MGGVVTALRGGEPSEDEQLWEEQKNAFAKRLEFFSRWRIEDAERVLDSYRALGRFDAPPNASSASADGGGSVASADHKSRKSADNDSQLQPREYPSVRTPWNEFLKIVLEAEEHRKRSSREARQWHPATRGYAMKRDEGAEELFLRWQASSGQQSKITPLEVPAAHTDDEESDVEEASSGAGAAMHGDDSEVTPGEGAGDSVASDPNRPPPPRAFDASLVSPVFFGYHGTTDAEVTSAAVAAAAAESAEEGRVVEARRARRRLQLDKMRAEHAKRREVRDNKLQQLKDDYAQAEKKRAKELEASRRVLPAFEYAQAERRANDDSAAASAAHRSELRERRLKFAHLSREETALLAARADESAAEERAEVTSAPRGHLLENFATKELTRLVAELEEAGAALEDAQQQLVAGRAELRGKSSGSGGGSAAGAETTAKSTLIVLEGQVAAREREAEVLMGQLDDAELLLRRARRIKAQEDQILPLYQPLLPDDAADSECNAPLFDVLTALGVAVADRMWEKLSYLTNVFDVNGNNFLDKEEMCQLLGALARVLLALKMSEIHTSAEEIESTVIRAFLEAGLDHKKGMTAYEVKRWLGAIAARSLPLSQIFGADWAYGEASTLMRMRIGAVRQFEMGMIGVLDLKYRVSRDLVRCRPCLLSERKQLMHERAMAMGEDDPLKPDYSRFRRKRRRALATNAVPLKHGHLENLTHWRAAVAEAAATKLQNNFRGRRARRAAADAARRQAFGAAYALARKEAAGRVRQEFEKRDRDTGVSRMKWDAAVRVRQARMRAAGEARDRAGVISAMAAEAVAEAEDNVRKRFEELAEERGFDVNEVLGGLDDGNGSVALAKRAENAIVVYANGGEASLASSGAAAARAAALDPEAAALSQLVEDCLQLALQSAGELVTNIAANCAARASEPTTAQQRASATSIVLVKTAPSFASVEEPATLRLLAAADADGGDQMSVLALPDGDSGRAPISGSVSVPEQAVLQSQEPTPLAARTAAALAAAVVAKAPFLSELRHILASMGIFPAALYPSGETGTERAAREDSSEPSADLESLVDRIRGWDSVMTKLKTEELLSELPSKRLLLQYALGWVRRAVPPGDTRQLIAELRDHFQVVRSADRIAAALLGLVSSDAEYGVAWRGAAGLLGDQEDLLASAAVATAAAGLAEAAAAAERSKRLASAQGKPIEEQEETDRENAYLETVRRKSAIATAKEGIAKHEKALRLAEQELAELQRRERNAASLAMLKQGGRPMAAIEPELRCDWAARYEAALAAPGDGPEQLKVKYSEIVSVCREFLAVAQRCAITVVDEMYLPDNRRTIKAVFEDPADGRAFEGGRGTPGTLGRDASGASGANVGRRLKFEAFGLRLKVCTDDHGLFDGADELAAKGRGGRERLGALEYAKCHVAGLVVPLTATIDYHGFRVLAAALLPTRRPVFSDAARLRRWRQELVHGTADRGRHVTGGVSEDRLLDQRLEEAAQRINLSRHGVRGSDELAWRQLWASADLRVFRLQREDAAAALSAPARAASDGVGKMDVAGPAAAAAVGTMTTFGALNFWRALPPELPEATPHLQPSPRGQSIFWRGLRPELVRANAVPLSPDACSLATAGAPDWEPQVDAVLAASRRLVEAVIPTYAGELRGRVKVAYDGRGALAGTVSTFAAIGAAEEATAASDQAPKALVNRKQESENSMTSADTAKVAAVGAAVDVGGRRHASAASAAATPSGAVVSAGLAWASGATAEMHRRGINVRHLGLLRDYFWRPLAGTVDIAHGSSVARTRCDFRRQLSEGDGIRVNGEVFVLVAGPKGQAAVTESELSLDRPARGPSRNAVAVEKGRGAAGLQPSDSSLAIAAAVTATAAAAAATEATSAAATEAALRYGCLAEMAARALKGLLRRFLRIKAQRDRATTRESQARLVADFLSSVTGAHALSDELWADQLAPDLRRRFGRLALDEGEVDTLRATLSPASAYLVRRLQEMIGFSLAPSCAAHFSAAPAGFMFTVADLADAGGPGGAPVAPPCRVKHSAPLLDFAEASLLMLQAQAAAAATYSATVASDAPSLYLPLQERRGATIAANRGRGGAGLGGRYSDGVRLERRGPLAADPLNFAALFAADLRCHVDTRATTDKLAPNAAGEGAASAAPGQFTAEVWVRVTGGMDTARVVVTTGRFCLAATRENRWALTVVSAEGVEVASIGPKVAAGAWTHVAGAYDGTSARVYVDGRLCACVEVEKAAARRVAEAKAELDAKLAAIAAEEAAAVQACQLEVARSTEAFLRTKEGRARISRAANRIIERADLALRLEAAAGGDPATRAVSVAGGAGAGKLPPRPTKAEARTQARQEYEAESCSAAVLRVAQEHQRRRAEVADGAAAEADELAERAAKPLRVGAAVGSRRSAEGRNFFAGEVCHVAVYPRALPSGVIAGHVASAGGRKAAEADRLFGMAQGRFASALVFSRGDAEVAARYAESLVRFAELEGTLRGPRASGEGSGGGSSGGSRPEWRVEEAVATLARLESWDGLAEVAARLPASSAYAEAFCRAFRAITAVEPGYFSRSKALPLRQLAAMPAKFGLVTPGARSAGTACNGAAAEALAVAVDIYRLVLSELSLADVYGEVDLSWLPAVRAPAVVVSMVAEAQRDSDARVIDLGSGARGRTSAAVAAGCHDEDGDSDAEDELEEATPEGAEGSGAGGSSSVEVVVVTAHPFRSSADAGTDAVAAAAAAQPADVGDEDVLTVLSHRRTAIVLDLSGCGRLSDASVAFAARALRQLRALSLDGCSKLTGEPLLRLANTNSGSLTALGLAGCLGLSEGALARLASACPQLKMLNLSRTPATSDAVVASFARQCPKLRELYLRFCVNIGDASLQALAVEATHQSLRTVDLSGCTLISDHGVAPLAQRCASLTALVLSGAGSVTTDGAAAVTHSCWSLERLSFADAHLVGDAAFRYDPARDGRRLAEAGMLSSITDLDLRDCARVTDAAVDAVGRRCPLLRRLVVSGCAGVTAAAFPLLVRDPATGAQRGSALRWLEAAYCPAAADGGLAAAAPGLAGLTALDLTGSPGVTDEGVAAVAEACRRIQRLSLARCRRLTDRSACFLASRLWLERLSIAGCVRLTDDGVEVLATEFAGLRSLDLSRCGSVTDRSLDALSRHCSQLTVLGMLEVPKVSAAAIDRAVGASGGRLRIIR